MSQKKRRKKGKGISFLTIFLLTVCVFGFVYFLRSDFFLIRHIYVQTTSMINKEEVTQKCNISIGSNLFDFKAAEIQDAIEKIPNVKNAVVVREYPDTVKIIVTERIPYMILYDGKQYYSIDSSGKVIYIGDLPREVSGMIVSGLGEIDLELGSYYVFTSDVSTQTAYYVLEFLTEKDLMSEISELHIDQDGCYYLYTDKTNVVKFYSWNAFESNVDFIESFIRYEQRQIVVEVIEGINPVYKQFDIN